MNKVTGLTTSSYTERDRIIKGLGGLKFEDFKKSLIHALDLISRAAVGGGGGSYTFSNGIGESAGVVKLGSPLVESTSINQDGFPLVFLNNTTDLANIGFFSMGGNPFVPSRDGFSMVLGQGDGDTYLNFDLQRDRISLNRSSNSNGRGAVIRIADTTASPESKPDIIIEAKEDDDTAIRYGISMDVESTEMYGFDPVLGMDILLMMVDGPNRRIIDQVRNLAGDVVLVSELATGSYSIHNPSIGAVWFNVASTTGNILIPAYGSAREDADVDAPNNFLYTDGVGNLRSSTRLYNYRPIIDRPTDYNVSESDSVVVLTLSSPATVFLPPTPFNGETHTIKDGAGTAATHNITLNGNGNNIDGASTVVMNGNWDVITVIFRETIGWLII